MSLKAMHDEKKLPEKQNELLVSQLQQLTQQLDLLKNANLEMALELKEQSEENERLSEENEQLLTLSENGRKLQNELQELKASHAKELAEKDKDHQADMAAAAAINERMKKEKSELRAWAEDSVRKAAASQRAAWKAEEEAQKLIDERQEIIDKEVKKEQKRLQKRYKRTQNALFAYSLLLTILLAILHLWPAIQQLM